MSNTASIRSFLSEARKYRVPLVVATQFLSQLDRDVATAIFGNVGTLICLRCNVMDAPVLQREMGEFTAEDLLNMEIGEAIVRMGPARDAFNLTIPEQVPPEKDFRKGIVARSRQLYCRPRAEVEKLLRGRPEAASRQQPSKQPGVKARERDNAPEAPGLTSDQWRMLEYLADHPEATVTAVYQALGFSGGRGATTRQHLLEQKLVVEVDTRLGQGNRPARFLVPTLAGLRAINKPLGNGGGGPVHRYLQELVASRARLLGYQVVELEHRLKDGSSVDVHLEKEGAQVATEIEVHSRPNRSCRNTRKCLVAGYQRVVALFLDPQLLQETRNLFIKDATADERQRVSFVELERLEEALK